MSQKNYKTKYKASCFYGPTCFRSTVNSFPSEIFFCVASFPEHPPISALRTRALFVSLSDRFKRALRFRQPNIAAKGQCQGGPIDTRPLGHRSVARRTKRRRERERERAGESSGSNTPLLESGGSDEYCREISFASCEEVGNVKLGLSPLFWGSQLKLGLAVTERLLTGIGFSTS